MRTLNLKGHLTLIKVFVNSLISWIVVAGIGLMVLGCQNKNSQDTENPKNNKTHQAVDTQKIQTQLNTRLDDQIVNEPQNPKNYYKRAKVYLKKGHPQLAIKDVEAAISIDSSKAKYHYLKGKILWERNNAKDANQSLNKALDYNQEMEEAYMLLGEIHFYLKNRKQSFQNINEALRLNKLNARGYYLKGMNYKEMGDTADAISKFQTSLEMDPDYYDVHIQLGMLHQQSNPKKAISYFTNAIDIRNNSVEAHYARAMAYQDQGAIKKAIQDYEKILTMVPRHRKANYNIAYLLFNQGKYEKAVPHFTNAIEKGEQYVEAYLGRGAAYKRMGKRKKAREDFEKVLELDPGNDIALSKLADLTQNNS